MHSHIGRGEHHHLDEVLEGSLRLPAQHFRSVGSIGDKLHWLTRSLKAGVRAHVSTSVSVGPIKRAGKKRIKQREKAKYALLIVEANKSECRLAQLAHAVCLARANDIIIRLRLL